MFKFLCLVNKVEKLLEEWFYGFNGLQSGKVTMCVNELNSSPEKLYENKHILETINEGVKVEMTKAKCNWCDAEFSPTHKGTKFCSNVCKKREQ